MLYKSVGDRVLQNGPYALGSQESHQLLPESRLKLAAMVSGDSGRNSELCYPTTDESLGHYLSSDVADGNGFWPASKPVDTSEDVCGSLGWGKRTNYVDVCVVEACIGVCKHVCVWGGG